MSNDPREPEADEPINDQEPEAVADEPQDGDEDSGDGRKGRAAAGWMISAGVHGVVLLVAALAVFGSQAILEQDTPPVRVNTIEAPKPPEEKKKPERTLEAQPQIDAATETENPSPTNTLDVPTEVTEREAETDATEPKGREEAMAESETGGSGAFMAIGAGGGSAGMFGNRSGGGRKRAVGTGGGSRGSEGAVEASLRWFKRHQSPDGKWDAVKYPDNCTEGAKCEPGTYSQYAKGENNVHAAMTGYALLCYLGAGYDHKTPNKYKSVVKKGLDYLLTTQKPDGMFGERNYEHPVGVMALAEAYAMTGDPALRGPAQKGVDMILARQNRGAGGKEYDRLGWDYTTPTKRNDNSITGWNIMALKSALAGGLNIGGGMDGAKVWLEQAWRASNENLAGTFKAWKDITPYDQSRFSYVWNTGDTGIILKENHEWSATQPASAHSGRSLESVGLVCGVFLGRTSGDTMIESLANTVMQYQVPTKYPCNTYYMYYNTMAIFQVGGDRWTKWNATVRDMLVNAQRKTDDCFDGSWDWKGTVFPGSDTGRVLSTAYNTLCLEVYYRYAQVKKMKH